MSRYSKNLSGVNQKVFVTPANVDYTTSTTYSAFIDAAAEGELGVFLDTGAVRTTALAAGLKFFVAQKRDGAINKTPIISWDDLFAKRRTAYVAPVRKVVSLGYGASSTSEDLTFSFTGASSTNTLTFGITARDFTPGNQPFPVQEGYATVNSATADEYGVLASIVSQLNGDYDYERTMPDRFVKAEINSDGTPTYLSSTIDPTLINGSRTVSYSANVTVAAGAFLVIRGAIYKVTTGVTAGQSLVIDRPYQGASETIDVSVETTAFANTTTYTSGTTKLGVKLTGLYDETNFAVIGAALLYASVATTVTAWKLGSGSGASVRELESTEGFIFDGVGSTMNAAFKADYGVPTLQSSTTGTYNLFYLDFSPTIFPSAALPIYSQKQIQRINIAVPSGGTNPDGELTTIFGL